MKNKFDYDGDQSKRYYRLASEASEDFISHPSFATILSYIKMTDDICEFGCGDGSKLYHFAKFCKSVNGFDLSKHAITLAKKKMPLGKFYVADSGKVFKRKKFNVTLSFFVLEHDQNPDTFIDEMLKQTKRDGYVICLCPNYGSPFFPSPPKVYGTRIAKKLIIICQRIKNYARTYRKKIYVTVDPILDKPFESDFDTISEVSLEKIVKKYKKKIILASSFWQLIPTSLQFYPYRFLRFLSDRGVVSLKYFGPQAFFIIKNI